MFWLDRSLSQELIKRGSTCGSLHVHTCTLVNQFFHCAGDKNAVTHNQLNLHTLANADCNKTFCTSHPSSANLHRPLTCAWGTKSQLLVMTSLGSLWHCPTTSLCPSVTLYRDTVIFLLSALAVRSSVVLVALSTRLNCKGAFNWTRCFSFKQTVPSQIF